VIGKLVATRESVKGVDIQHIICIDPASRLDASKLWLYVPSDAY
jgi:hypothetical protein